MGRNGSKTWVNPDSVGINVGTNLRLYIDMLKYLLLYSYEGNSMNKNHLVILILVIGSTSLQGSTDKGTEKYKTLSYNFPKVIESQKDLQLAQWLISRDGYVKANIDPDAIDDIAVVLETKKKDWKTGYGKRVFLLYKGNKEGKFELHTVAKKAVYGQMNGGMMGDPFQGLEFYKKSKVLAIVMYGGSAHRWSVIYKYRFQKNQLQLIGQENQRFSVFETEKVSTTDTNYSTKKYHVTKTGLKSGRKTKKFKDRKLAPISIEAFDAFAQKPHLTKANNLLESWKR